MKQVLDRERKLYDIAYVWNLKKWYKWTYLQSRNRLTDLESEHMVTEWGKERGKDT